MSFEEVITPIYKKMEEQFLNRVFHMKRLTPMVASYMVIVIKIQCYAAIKKTVGIICRFQLMKILVDFPNQIDLLFNL